MRRRVEQGMHMLVPTIVLYEWLRGARTVRELKDQEDLFPSRLAEPFLVADATLAARLYRKANRARHREIDLAIAACAITREAELWTLNPRDFEDIPDLSLAAPD